MATREEIRKEITALTSDYISAILGKEWVAVELTNQILSFLHSQGVVIKVDRELPANPLDKAELVDTSRRLYQIGNFCFDDSYRLAYNAGFCFYRDETAGVVEPLVK